MFQEGKEVKGLIPYAEVSTNSGPALYVDGRKVHAFLAVKKDFSDWIRYNIKRFGFRLGEDFSTRIGENYSGTGRPLTEYLLSLDMAKELCMISRTEKGREARKYFITIEKEHRLGGVPVKPQPLDSETSRLFNSVLGHISQHSPTAAQTVGARMLEAYGIEIPHYARPRVLEERWSATEIANKLELSPQMVGRISNKLGLKKAPHGEERMSVAPGTNKEVTMWYYNSNAVAQIEKYITE